MIGIRTERRMVPCVVDRCRARAAPSPELGDPAIENRRSGEVVRERIGGKMWEAPRSGETSNIGHELDVVHGEQSAKLGARARRMTNRPNGEGHVER
jgi:hypothetical protein